MAPPQPLSKAATPKPMSSRLMTMKFMQRGAAINAAASDAGSPTTPKIEEEESASKRRKLSTTSGPNTPNTPATPLYDNKAIQAAMDDQEKKRQAAIEQRAAELGDSHWVLDGLSSSSKTSAPRVLNILQVGFSQIDSTANSGEGPNSPGGANIPAPARFRQFNMKKKKEEDEDDESSDSSDSDGSDEESSQESKQEPDRGRRSSANDSGRKRARSSLSTKRDDKKQIAQELARERRKKEVNLNKLSSISGSGGPPPKSPQFTCRSCGKPGHKFYQCPKRG